MRIRELLSYGRPSISFEFFPPKDEAGFDRLRQTLASLRDLRPTYVSVTYGASGAARRETIRLTTELRRDYGLEAMAHLTCVGSSQDELRSLLENIERGGVENLLALRGDPPTGTGPFQPHPQGFRYACELVALARKHSKFCVLGACYPEGHVEAPSLQADLDNLKRKVDAGCEVLITQLFFDNNKYFDFVARARAAGIGVPIIPGIMPITNVAQVKRFTRTCGASIPATLVNELHRLQDDPHAVLSMGVAHATAQCIELLQRGAPGLHFYTLNKSPATRTILTAIRTVYPPANSPAGT
ncbi:MAG TPA: methylenetetrahydrofolate reductase [NAD(P)H] [Phycisphaerae bacterium]|jgi:methylenetetrahydrofolate reductase (NADPH)|nr:methylenetetrahydrofolate reductase [NAD(P)H] [Phycisphaerae bacterium]HRS26996.1 methylenetetrahydrofolate reductase [NAD(P)H] [Phycisphaerae bacterium]